MDNLEKECVEYFKQNTIWKKLFSGFQKKYESYGSFSGSVRLSGLSEADIETLEGFFGQNYHGKKSVTISAERFRKALAGSRYGTLTAERILTLYFGAEPVWKKEQSAQRKREQDEILSHLRERCVGTPAKACMKELVQWIKCDRMMRLSDWERKLQQAVEIYNALPYRQGKVKYLAIFAAQMTGNPHAFDAGTDGGRLLDLMVELDLHIRRMQVPAKKEFHAYRRQKSYLETGVLIDDISNSAMLYGVRAWTQDGKPHQGMEGFLTEQDMVQVPLAVISQWKRLTCLKNRMYIVENPVIYAHLCQNADGTCAYMCMNGQPRLAGLLILDLLAKSNVEVYYAGDMDPEGLLIAQKLAAYYSGSFTYWQMSVEMYHRSISDELISPRRLKILDRIEDPRIYPLAQEIRKYKKAGYQENLLKYEQSLRR